MTTQTHPANIKEEAVRTLWRCTVHDTHLFKPADTCPRWGTERPPTGYADHDVQDCHIIEGLWVSNEEATIHTLAGLLDYRNETPGKHAPISFEEWRNGTDISPEHDAYWRGYALGIEEDANRAHQSDPR